MPRESVMQKQEKASDKVLNKFHEIELEQLYEAILSTKNLRLQLASFFGTANLAVMSLAFTSQKAGLFLFAALLIWIAVLLDSRSRRSVVTYYFRILQMSHEYSNDDGFYFNFIPSTSLDYVHKLLRYDDKEKQIEGLRKIPLRSQSVSAFWLPILASIIEVIIGVIFWQILGWNIF